MPLQAEVGIIKRPAAAKKAATVAAPPVASPPTAEAEAASATPCTPPPKTKRVAARAKEGRVADLFAWMGAPPGFEDLSPPLQPLAIGGRSVTLTLGSLWGWVWDFGKLAR